MLDLFILAAYLRSIGRCYRFYQVASLVNCLHPIDRISHRLSNNLIFYLLLVQLLTVSVVVELAQVVDDWMGDILVFKNLVQLHCPLNRLYDAYLDGASIIVNHVDKLWLPLNKLCQVIILFIFIILTRTYLCVCVCVCVCVEIHKAASTNISAHLSPHIVIFLVASDTM